MANPNPKRAADESAVEPQPAPAPNEAVKAMAEVRLAAQSNRRFQQARLQPAESSYQRFALLVEAGTTRADLERTSAWEHIARFFRLGDEVRVKCEDGSFIAYLLVAAVGPKDVKMHVLDFIELTPIDPTSLDIPAGYDINWRGEIAKHSVLRGATVLKDGFESRALAQRWLTAHLQSMLR